LEIINRLKITFFLLSITGCAHNPDSSEILELYLNHYKSECNSFELELCPQSRINENDDWSFYYDHIEGFDYEWGFTYKIKVKVENIENPPEDSSSVKYTLLEIIEKTKETTASLFDISVSRATGLLVKESENTYNIYNEIKIECIDSDCEVIDSLIVQDMAILLEFKHQIDTERPLKLTQVKCSSSRESFRNSCL
jgi:hypothetical protein